MMDKPDPDDYPEDQYAKYAVMCEDCDWGMYAATEPSRDGFKRHHEAINSGHTVTTEPVTEDEDDV